MSEIILTENNSENLKKIETELNNIARKDKQNWSNFYILLKEVETKELWKDNFKSFTAWVKHFANVSGMKESIIWNRKRAGEVYERYANVKFLMTDDIKEEDIAPVENVDIAQDTLILIDKIAKGNSQMEVELVDKALSGELRPKDLRNTYYALRATDERYNTEDKPFNKHTAEEHRDNVAYENKDVVVTAVDIVDYLKDASWLEEHNQRKKEKDDSIKQPHERFKKFYEKQKYNTYTEFPVYTGTTRHSRRIDVLAVENITTANSWDVALHGIEIKVSKSDLKNDCKYTEYMDFVDYMWLAVPEELAIDAITTKPEEVGLIVIREDGKITINDDAMVLNPEKRDRALETLVLKLI